MEDQRKVVHKTGVWFIIYIYTSCRYNNVYDFNFPLQAITILWTTGCFHVFLAISTVFICGNIYIYDIECRVRMTYLSLNKYCNIIDYLTKKYILVIIGNSLKKSSYRNPRIDKAIHSLMVIATSRGAICP